jgi:hypothetical protein
MLPMPCGVARLAVPSLRSKAAGTLAACGETSRKDAASPESRRIAVTSARSSRGVTSQHYRTPTPLGFGPIIVTLLTLGSCHTCARTQGIQERFLTGGTLITSTSQTAQSFNQSIGVNLHPNFYDTTYGSYAAWKSSLLAGGFTHARVNFDPGDAYLASVIKDLASSGVKVEALVNYSTSPSSVYNALKADPALAHAIWGIENPNEYDLSGDPSWAANLRSYTINLSNVIKGDPATAGIQIIAPDVTWNGSQVAHAQLLGNLSAYVDYGNVHAYSGGTMPSDSFISAELQVSNIVAPGKPMLQTEIGYPTQQPEGSDAGFPPMAETQAAILMPRVYFENFRAGIAYTDVYEFLNERADAGFEDSFGFLHADYTPKPEYTVMKNITTLLADPGGAASFTPGQLTYGLQGADAQTRSLLLEKQDGSFWLAVWEQVEVWDPQHQVALNPPPVPVTLNLAAAASGAVYVPNSNGTSPVSSFTDTQSVAFGSSAAVTLIQLSPSSAPPAPAPGPSPSPPTGSIMLHVSGDQWQGDPQFMVFVDGVQLGDTYNVSASHSAGQWQDITIPGSFASGLPQQVQVAYSNNAYGGTPTTDRNLYIGYIDVNEHRFSGALVTNNTAANGATAPDAAVMMRNGTVTFDTSPTSEITLHVSGDSWKGAPQLALLVDGHQVGTAQVTALHSAGQWQDITFSGNYGTLGPNQVQVQFTNDASGGTTSHDRNLYVGSIDVNGHHFLGSAAVSNTASNGATLPDTAVMIANGTATFGTVGSAPAPYHADSEIAPTSGGQTLTGTLHNEIIIGGPKDVLIGNGGQDLFVYRSLSDSSGSITDFNLTGDQHSALDLRPLMGAIGYHGTDPIADHVLSFTADGTGSTRVVIDPDGTGPAQAIGLVTLQHVLPTAITASDYLWHA